MFHVFNVPDMDPLRSWGFELSLNNFVGESHDLYVVDLRFLYEDTVYDHPGKHPS